MWDIVAVLYFPRLLLWYGVLSHKAPEQGEAPGEPPPPPWQTGDKVTKEYLALCLILFHPSAYMKIRSEVFDSLPYADLDDEKRKELAKSFLSKSLITPDNLAQPSL